MPERPHLDPDHEPHRDHRRFEHSAESHEPDRHGHQEAPATALAGLPQCLNRDPAKHIKLAWHLLLAGGDLRV